VSDDSDDDKPPYWVLISILFSSFPISPTLAMSLHRAAYDLYRRDDAVGKVETALAQGQVRNLKKPMLLGTLAGPGFEAELDTQHGAGRVQFLLTQRGLEWMAESEPRAAAN
jgi:hypothetical protein